MSPAPINYFLNKDIKLTSPCEEKLKTLSSLNGVESIAVLPDVHAKPDNPFPTGTAIVSPNFLFPAAIGQDIGCGMAVFKLKTDGVFDVSAAKNFFSEASKNLPDVTKGYALEKEDLFEIFQLGLMWAVKRGIIKEEELINVENKGNAFDDGDLPRLDRIFPSNVIKSGLKKTSHLGGGNHFMEIQEVTEVLDYELASSVSLKAGDFILMIHTGSGSFGKRFEVYFTDRMYGASSKTVIKHTLRKALYHLPPVYPNNTLHMLNTFFLKKGIRIFKDESCEGRKYIAGHRACLNYAYVNRFLILSFLKEIIKKKQLNINFELLYDVVHESIQKEEINGKDVWIHRNGAARAYPASKLKWHPVFSKTGQLLPLPGSMASDSYLTFATENVKNSFFSVNHGAGRVLEKSEVRENISKERLESFLKEKGDAIFMAGNKENLIEQLPDTFKDINIVLDAIKQNGLVRPFARLKPVANIKV